MPRSPKTKARQARYDATPKGKARHHRYNATPGKAAANARYRETHLVLRMGDEKRHVYPVPEGATKAELQERLATFRQKQREEYRDARIG